MEVQVFGKQDCAKCETTAHKLRHYIGKLGVSDRVTVQFIDMDTLEGLTEGTYRDVFDIPTTIIQRDGHDLIRWEGVIPPSAEIKQFLGSA